MVIYEKSLAHASANTAYFCVLSYNGEYLATLLIKLNESHPKSASVRVRLCTCAPVLQRDVVTLLQDQELRCGVPYNSEGHISEKFGVPGAAASAVQDCQKNTSTHGG